MHDVPNMSSASKDMHVLPDSTHKDTGIKTGHQITHLGQCCRHGALEMSFIAHWPHAAGETPSKQSTKARTLNLANTNQTQTWAAQYNIWLLIKLTPKSVVFSFFSLCQSQCAHLQASSRKASSLAAA